MNMLMDSDTNGRVVGLGCFQENGEPSVVGPLYASIAQKIIPTVLPEEFIGFIRVDGGEPEMYYGSYQGFPERVGEVAKSATDWDSEYEFFSTDYSGFAELYDESPRGYDFGFCIILTEYAYLTKK